MSNGARDRVLEIFRIMGRGAVSRQAVSYGTTTAYPSLDPVLRELLAEGLIERVMLRVEGDELKPADELRATDKLMEKTRVARQQAKLFAEELARREQLRAQEEETKRQTIERANLERKTAKEREQAEKRLARQRAVDKYQAKRAAVAAERYEQRKAASETAAARRAAERKSLRIEMKSQPMELPAPRALPRPANSDDPWAKIRARHYAKPELVPSALRELTPYEKMTGRRERQC